MKAIDLSGQKFGHLTVVAKTTEKNRWNEYLYDCECICGKHIKVRSQDLKSGNTKSCGCMSNVKDITGKRFGKLLVLERSETKRSEISYLCRCDCGNEKIISGHSLRAGRTVSCGCFNKENLQKMRTKHSLYRTRIYRIYQGMKQRCYNKNFKHYRLYGGRGISVCDEWLKDVKAFYEWAVKNGYSDNLTIDRIDVNGNYEPKNCRWVSMKEQGNNRNTNHFLTYKGQRKTIAEWAEEMNISPAVISGRIRSNWALSDVFTVPVNR